MSILSTLWADLQKLFAFAPIVAAVDPAEAGNIALASAAVAALQPTVTAVQNAANGTLAHADLVAGVTAAVSGSSAELTSLGLVTSTLDQHLQAAAPLINAAVAISGLAKPAA